MAGVYPGFLSMKPVDLGVLLFFPPPPPPPFRGRGASQSQGFVAPNSMSPVPI